MKLRLRSKRAVVVASWNLRFKIESDPDFINYVKHFLLIHKGHKNIFEAWGEIDKLDETKLIDCYRRTIEKDFKGIDPESKKLIGKSILKELLSNNDGQEEEERRKGNNNSYNNNIVIGDKDDEEEEDYDDDHDDHDKDNDSSHVGENLMNSNTINNNINENFSKDPDVRDTNISRGKIIVLDETRDQEKINRIAKIFREICSSSSSTGDISVSASGAGESRIGLESCGNIFVIFIIKIII